MKRETQLVLLPWSRGLLKSKILLLEEADDSLDFWLVTSSIGTYIRSLEQTTKYGVRHSLGKLFLITSRYGQVDQDTP